ncbi:MAG: hypothetical protein SGILL_007583 [Bacillariaceae sp.]
MEDSAGFQYGKEMASLSPFIKLHKLKQSLEQEQTSLEELLQEIDGDSDPDLFQECHDELDKIETKQIALQQRIQNALLPKDEDDTSDAILEIRAGTGGDEAALFAAVLKQAYEKTALANNFQVSVMQESRTDLGGIKETVLSISSSGRSGNNNYGGDYHDDDNENEDDSSASLPPSPYGRLKFESGVHRVQRVPVNDTRIHTSACSVAVLPLQPPQSNNNSTETIPMTDLRIETMRSSGAGGQHVNTTDSAVRITHIPTGITASIQDARSQHKNKDKALKLIAARVRNAEREQESKNNAALRSSLLGGGDRSERIRTYNYPQDRVTDHRCKHSVHGIAKLLQGDVEDGLVTTFYPILLGMVREEQIASMEEGQDEEQ